MSTGDKIKELEHRVAQLEDVVANNAAVQGESSMRVEMQLIALRHALIHLGMATGYERAGELYVEGLRKAAVGSYIVDWAMQLRETYGHLSLQEPAEEEEVFRSTSSIIE